MKITQAQIDKINKFRNTTLVVAARVNDTKALTDHDITKTVRALGLDIETLKYVIEQRALRVGWDVTPKVFAALLDAICIGWSARGYSNGSDEYLDNQIKDPITIEEFDAWTA
jgi:hypothetical protein